MASKYKKNKVKFKLTKELVILIVALIAIASVTIALAIPTKHEKFTKELNEYITIAAESTQTEQTQAQPNLLGDDHVFKKASLSSIENAKKSDSYTYVIYASQNSKDLLPLLSQINTICDDLEIEEVYFYSSLWMEKTEDKESESFKAKKDEIENVINEHKDANVNAFSVEESQTILVFKNDELIINSQDYTDNEAITWTMKINKCFYISKADELANK